MKQEYIFIPGFLSFLVFQTQEIYTRNMKVVTDRQEQHGTWEDGECDGTRLFSVCLKINFTF